ncbi:MAG: hypothetical protein U1U88_001900 [Lawsonella clevelandensis]
MTAPQPPRRQQQDRTAGRKRPSRRHTPAPTPGTRTSSTTNPSSSTRHFHLNPPPSGE